MNIQISDDAYAALMQAAQIRGTTPESFIEDLVLHLSIGHADDEDGFYRAMGMNDEQIAQIKERAKLLPDDPDW